MLIGGKPLSRLGFGCSSFWAKPAFPEARARDILEIAADLGVTYFDTGPSYAEGEDRLGRFLAGRESAALIVSTKVGTLRGGGRSFAPTEMRRSLDGSLERLGRAKVDILYLHGPSVGDLDTTTIDHLLAEKSAGRVGLIGVNSFEPKVVRRLLGLPIDVVMLQYNVADQRFARLISELSQAGKIVVAGTALAQGVYDLRGFVPRSRRSAWYLMRQVYRDPLFAWRGARLGRRLRRVDPDPHAAALRFTAGHELIASAVFNSTDPAHVRANIAAAARPLGSRERALLTVGAAA